jgi:hypothetical protein
MNQGTQGYSLMKKIEGRKSRDTVSLRAANVLYFQGRHLQIALCWQRQELQYACEHSLFLKIFYQVVCFRTLHQSYRQRSYCFRGGMHCTQAEFMFNNEVTM